MHLWPAVELHELSKSFRLRRARGAGLRARIQDFVSPRTEAVLAVDRLSFRIDHGERVAFIGPNGAGKSTTLKMLTGLVRPDTGFARVLGFDPSRQRAALSFYLGTVFGQRSQLWYQLPPRDTFRLLGHVYDVHPTTLRRRMETLAELLALGPSLDTPVRQLSLGQRMRCELLASLLHGPRVLVLDEPTIGLDVTSRATIRDLLRAESVEKDTTLLLTSHDTEDIERVCDRVIVIHRGRLVWDGAIPELRRQYLTTKRITLWSEVERLDLRMPGVRTLSSACYRTELEVTVAVTSVARVVARALQVGAVRDLAIEDGPLDVVIRALYAASERRLPC